MQFSQISADIFIPSNGLSPSEALASVTHLCVAAHQDDIEIMAHAGISQCLDIPNKHFGGVVVTNGAGSPRSGPYQSMSDEQMQIVRRDEQRRAAELGNYAIQLQLAHPSANVKQPRHPEVLSDLKLIFEHCTPEIVYLHNPIDKHDTHVALMLRCIESLRELPPAKRPQRVLGCEVWRDLDWLVDADKIALDSGKHTDLGLRLLQTFDSQVAGGKRYDIATLGRRSANATFHNSHSIDSLSAITWAMDLTPLILNPTLSIIDFSLGCIDRLRSEAARRLGKFC